MNKKKEVTYLRINSLSDLETKKEEIEKFLTNFKLDDKEQDKIYDKGDTKCLQH